jgi:ABC-type phosphate/phosphonate transport system substrate-binding protein
MAGQVSPMPNADFVIEDVSENEVPVQAGSSSSFLEDAMLSEFATASTRQMENWSGPITSNPIPNGPITNNPDLDEEEKAALRRELMGSYILE